LPIGGWTIGTPIGIGPGEKTDPWLIISRSDWAYPQQLMMIGCLPGNWQIRSAGPFNGLHGGPATVKLGARTIQGQSDKDGFVTAQNLTKADIQFLVAPYGYDLSTVEAFSTVAVVCGQPTN
jgi:hypothetical protein